MVYRCLHLSLARQRKLNTELYCEPQDEVIIGHFVSPTEQVPIERPQKPHRKVSVQETETTRSKDIRLLFRHQEKKCKNQDENEKIVID